jgi:hypothetical protein
VRAGAPAGAERRTAASFRAPPPAFADPAPPFAESAPRALACFRNFSCVAASDAPDGRERRGREDTMNDQDDDRAGLGGVIWGLALIALGLLFLFERLGVLSWHVWMVWWPLVVIAIGLGQAVSARRAKRVGDGVTLLLMGGWFLLASNEWYGLSWGNSWPLALVAAGAGMLARWVAAHFMPDLPGRRARRDGVVIGVDPRD